MLLFLLSADALLTYIIVFNPSPDVGFILTRSPLTHIFRKKYQFLALLSWRDNFETVARVRLIVPYNQVRDLVDDKCHYIGEGRVRSLSGSTFLSMSTPITLVVFDSTGWWLFVVSLLYIPPEAICLLSWTTSNHFKPPKRVAGYWALVGKKGVPESWRDTA